MYPKRIILFLFFFIALFPALSSSQEGPSNEDCLACHDAINVQEYHASIHGSRACVSCHSDIREAPHPQKPSKVNCSNCHMREVEAYDASYHGEAVKSGIQAANCPDCHGQPHAILSARDVKSGVYRFNIPKTCGECHGDILDTYLNSVHGKAMTSGNWDAPVCTDCHGEHTIKSHDDPESSVYSTMITKKTCGQCHAAERIITKYRLPSDRVDTYLQSYHGLASKSGVTIVANCASCHGVHNILPASDPNSDVNAKNLPKTCGKCHPNAGTKLSEGSVHVSPSIKKDQAVFYVAWFYVILIVFTIGGMLAHNFLDLLSTVRAYYQRHKKEAEHIRFTLNERLQHLGLMITFVLLAYTGFALRYPDAWWAIPFTVWNPGFDWRGIIHRITAVFFVILVITHIFYLFFTERGREQRKALLIRWKDFTDFFQTMAYYFGMRKGKPKYDRYNYIEKAEYWALVWGSFIMIVTGAILTFENFFFKFFPKWVFDVVRTIHYYEAVLAALAIVIWHLYFNMFHPRHYPINFSMFTGKVSKEDREEEDDI